MISGDIVPCADHTGLLAGTQLKHTYLRVLHPLLTNTQLRHYPYKRQELRECLESLLAGAQYRDVDPTTRRLVERNLRGTWCQGLRNNDTAAVSPTTAAAGAGVASAGASTLSVDAVAIAEGDEPAHVGTTTTTTTTNKARRHPRQPSTSLSGGEPHRKSRKHASADDLRHHHHHQHQHWVPSAQDGYLVTGDEGAGDGEEAVYYPQSPTTTTESSFSPHALAQARFDDDDGVAETQNRVFAPSSVPERIDVVRPSSSSCAAVELTRSTPSLRIPPPPLPPPIATQDHLPTLQHPRPRSSSLSAAAYHTSLGLAGSGNGSSSRASPALPAFPTTAPASPLPPSPALSSVSLSGSIDSPTSPTSHSASSRFSEAGGHRRRRRPPPPPIDAGGGGGGGGALAAAAAAISGSRPLTPVSRASTVDTVESEQSAAATDSSCGVYAATVQSRDHHQQQQHLSPAHSVSSISTTGHRRRRPPPPPKPGGLRDRDRDHDHHHDAELDARRLLDGLAVSS